MKLKLTFIVGLPGSGKSFLGKQLEGHFIDDASLHGIQIVKDAVRNRISPLIVADVFLCRDTERIHAIMTLSGSNYDIEWIFFENNPEKCLANVHRRDDGRKVEGLIRQLTKEYTIPIGATVREIYDD